MKSENPVFAIGAWINPNAKSRPVSIMLEQKGEATNLIGFMMGQRNRKVATVSFSEDVASSIGINVSELQEGYDNVTPINFNMSEIISCIKGNKVERYNNLNIMMKKYIHSKLFFKQQPNMILIRKDVLNFIKNDYTEYFKYLECPDEHYFINIMINIFREKFIMKQITFCNPDLNKTQALEFNNVDDEFIYKIRNLGFLFMRKVNLKSIISNNIFK
jgi:hypothetical protein